MLMEHGFLSRALKHLVKLEGSWDSRDSSSETNLLTDATENSSTSNTGDTNDPPSDIGTSKSNINTSFPINIKDLSLCEETLREDLKATDELLNHTITMVTTWSLST